tara:strand:+ start:2658 stop:3341 length:684 start_codon:yes stop_codon:yes gene_type:complete
MTAKSVLIVDDHPIVIMGLKSFLNRNKLFKCIYSALNATEALSIIRLKKKEQKEIISKNKTDIFDLVILDINLPDMEITVLIEKILAEIPKVKILILSMESPILYIRRLLELGIRGFVEKGVDDNEMLYAINTILNNRKYFSGEDLLEYMTCRTIGKENGINTLSSRESEILSLLLKGKSVTEICNILHLHKSSIGTYKSRIFHKLGVKNMVELYQFALVEKLVKTK